MPEFDFNTIRSESRDTNLTGTGTIAVPVVNGPVILQDKIRYIWRLKATNAAVAPHELIMFAWDGVAAAPHTIFKIEIPAGTDLIYPADATPDKPVIRIRPDTSGVALVNAENQTYFADEGAGALIASISYSYYEKRG